MRVEKEPRFQLRARLGARHHFLPKFYLRGFTDPDTPPKYEPYLWLCKFDEGGRWKRRSPDNVATQRDLYVVTTKAGQKHDLLEQSLGLLETAVAPLVRDKIERARPLAEADRLNFAAFLAQTIARTPASLQLVAQAYKIRYVQWFKKRVENWTKNAEAWGAFKKRFNDSNPKNPLADSLRPEEIHPDKFRIGAPPFEQMAAQSLASSWAMVPALLEMGWSFFRTTPPLYFITSDNPCARIDFDRKDDTYPAGIGAPNVEISFPLTKTQCFVASRAWKGDLYRLSDSELVAHLNQRTFRFARRFIAAPKPGFPGSADILKAIADDQRHASTMVRRSDT